MSDQATREAEQALLGALLQSGNAFDRIADRVCAEDFLSEWHRTAFSVIAREYQAGRQVDSMLVADALGNPTDENGPLPTLRYLVQLGSSSLGSANVAQYAAIVVGNSKLRRLAQLGAELQSAAAAPLAVASEIAEKATKDLLQALDNGPKEPVALADAMAEALAYADERQSAGAAISGLEIGIESLDRKTGGFEPGQLIIVAARPAVGKTAFACSAVQYLASHGRAVLFFSLEMANREIAQRILAIQARVSVAEQRSGVRDDAKWHRLSAATGAAQGLRVFVDDMPAISAGYVRAKARRIQRQHGLDMVVVDYLGLMRGVGSNRTQEIGSISRDLKAIAKELGVPVMALAQLNRNLESRASDKRPLLSDLRDSGEVEQDADIVLMLHREELYDEAAQWQGVAELLVRKNRNGPSGDCLLSFEHEFGLFSDAGFASPRMKLSPRLEAKRGFGS